MHVRRSQCRVSDLGLCQTSRFEFSGFVDFRMVGKNVNAASAHEIADVSVVITCFNYGPYVGAAIRSVLDQTVRVRQIVAVDDGSTDNSLEVIREFAPPVEVVTQPNAGVVAAKNLGLGLATARWIIFLDADDILDPRYVEKTLGAALRRGVDVVYTNMTFVGAMTGIVTARPFNRWSLARGNYIHNSALMKRDFVREAGGYKAIMASGFEDWELYLSLAERGMKAHWVPESLLSYRRHVGGGRDSGANAQRRAILTQVQKLHPSLYTRRRRLIALLHACIMRTASFGASKS